MQKETLKERVYRGIYEAVTNGEYKSNDILTENQMIEKFGVSKSTVHKDLQDRLPQFNRSLYLQVKEVLEVNKAQRHIRGGLATRKKYKGF